MFTIFPISFLNFFYTCSVKNIKLHLPPYLSCLFIWFSKCCSLCLENPSPNFPLGHILSILQDLVYIFFYGTCARSPQPHNLTLMFIYLWLRITYLNFYLILCFSQFGHMLYFIIIGLLFPLPTRYWGFWTLCLHYTPFCVCHWALYLICTTHMLSSDYTNTLK